MDSRAASRAGRGGRVAADRAAVRASRAARAARAARGGRQEWSSSLDPNMVFNMLSGGKDYLSESDYLANPMVTARDPNAKDRIEAFMQRNGITNGQLTREQFAQMFQERMAERQAQRAAQNPDSSQTPGSQGATTDPNADAGDEPVIEDKRPTVYRATNLPKQGLPTWFAQLDAPTRTDRSAFTSGRRRVDLQSEFQTWDLNGDGFITVEEAMRVAKGTAGGGVSVASGRRRWGQAPRPFGQFQGGPPQGSNEPRLWQWGRRPPRARQRRTRGNFQNQNTGGY